MAINRPPTVELKAAQEEAEGQQLSVGMQRHSPVGQDSSLAAARTAKEANTHEYFMVLRETRGEEG